MIYKAFAVALLLAAGSLNAQTPDARARLLVQPDWLAKHLRDPNIVLLHLGQRPEYDAGHIPGARFLSLQDISMPNQTGDLTLQMLPPDQLRERLAGLGISDNSRIVVYFGRENPSVTPTARALFTLDYAGLGDRASVLDGGMEAWVKSGQALSADVPAPRAAGTLAPLTIRPIVVDAEFVKTNLAATGIAIVDGRNSGFYSGAQTGGGPSAPHKTGHIQGAHSVPFSQTVDEANRLKPAAELQTLFADAGVKPGDTVVAYCHIGMQATQVILAARSLGYKVLLYDGSFEEWSRQDYPVESNAKR